MKNYLALLLREHRKQHSPLLRGTSASPLPAHLTESFPSGPAIPEAGYSPNRGIGDEGRAVPQSLFKLTVEVLMQLDALLHQFMEQNLAKCKGLVICSASTWRLLNLGAENKGSRQTPGSALTSSESNVVH